MVVASIGWVQNTNYSLLNQIENNNMNTTVYDNNTTNNNNNNINNNTNNNNNKMSAKGMLICRDNSHAFQDRTLNLDEAVKIGRSVARTRASIDNAIFDCKVLSRNHAQLWYKNGKFYLQDTGSSNGTFVNNQRLSTTGSESKAKEVCSGDIVQFGVDVIESTKKVTHGCIIATLKLYLPDGKEAISNRSMYVTRQADVTLEDLYKLNQYVQEASRREKVLQSKLTHLQKLVDNMKVSASQSWKALIDEDRLLSRVKTVESQLVAYSKNFTEDKIRNELVKLEEEKSQYQIVAKDTLQKVHQEKIELSQKIMHLECRLNETEDECQSLHDISKNTQLELQELAVKYTTSQKNLLQLEVSCNEKEQNNIDLIKTHEQEKQDIIDKLKQHNKIEIYLKNKLKQYRIDRINIHKQLTILKNYLQPSFNNDGTIIDASTNIIPNSIMDTINITLDDILNESSNIDIDNIDDSLENLINLQSNDSNEKLTSTSIADTTTTTTTTNSSITTATERSNSYEKNDDIDNNNDNEDNDDDEEETNNREIHAEYILPPTSRRTLVNGKINVENDNDDDDDDDNDDDDCSEISGQTCIINDKNNSINDRNGDDDDDDGDDTSDEKSIIENKKIDDVINRDINKLEVRFASDVNGEQLETIHYDKDDKNNNNDDDDEDDDGDDGDGDETGQGDDSSDSADSPNASFSSVTATDGNDDKDDCIEKCEEWKIDDDEEEEDGEHLEDSISQCHTTNNIERKKNVQLINPMKRKLEEFQIVNKMAGGTSTSNGDSSQNRICRDFLRNVCHRGKRCKYIHERTHDNPIDEYTFCHDYQNGMCNWPGCKFLHCTENEEKHFRTTGELPAHIINRIKNINNDVNKIELPVCKDFIKGSCQRLNCKFRHYKKDEVQNNNTNNNINNNNNNNNNNSNCSNTIQPHINPPRSQQHFNGNNNNNVNGDQRHFEEDRNYHWQIEDQHPMIINSGYNASPHPGDYLSPPEPKRRIISGETVLHFETSPQLVGQQITSGYYYPVIARNEARSFVLEDENSLLRKKIDELKKKVSDLTATNEFLLDQNAQLRMSGKRTTSVTAVTVPAVTITPTQAPTPQQMVNAAVAAGTLRTVTASVATVPVSIATVTPVSIAAVSMAPVSIPQPIVTMAQQTITMSGVGPQQNNQQQQNSQQTNNLPLSLSGATGLSYPIMTQELRPVLQ